MVKICKNNGVSYGNTDKEIITGIIADRLITSKTMIAMVMVIMIVSSCIPFFNRQIRSWIKALKSFWSESWLSLVAKWAPG